VEEVQQVGAVDPRRLAAIGRNLNGMQPRTPVAPAFGPPSGPSMPTPGAIASQPGANQGAGRATGLRNLMKSPNFKRNALIGAGIIAAASVAQSKRSDGTSRGRQSNYRY